MISASSGRAAPRITVLTAAGLILGFAANMVTAGFFGVGAAMDAYLAASTLPALVTLVLTTSLGATFLPAFAEARERDPADAWRAATSLMNLVALACLAVCLAGILFAGPLARISAPGFDAEQTARTAQLMRWLWPGVLLAAVNQLLGGLYHADGRFVVPLLIRVGSPLCTILFAATLAKPLGVLSLALATLAAQALHTAALVAGLGHREDGFPRPYVPFDARHPMVRRVARLAAPMLVAMCVYKLGPAFERWLASGMGEGALSTLGYARRLPGILQPVLASGVVISGFALLSRSAAQRDVGGVRRTLDANCRALLFAGVPLAVFLAAFAHPLLSLLFERGAFTAGDVDAVHPLFALYALALPLVAVGTVIGQAFYALGDTRTPTWLGCADLALFAGLSWGLAPSLGLAAFPVAQFLAYFATSAWMGVRLRRRTGFRFPLRPLAAALLASALALLPALALRALAPEARTWALACFTFAFIMYFLAQRYAFRSAEAVALASRLRPPAP